LLVSVVVVVGGGTCLVRDDASSNLSSISHLALPHLFGGASSGRFQRSLFNILKNGGEVRKSNHYVYMLKLSSTNLIHSIQSILYP
jgi:hypothetical protein